MTWYTKMVMMKMMIDRCSLFLNKEPFSPRPTMNDKPFVYLKRQIKRCPPTEAPVENIERLNTKCFLAGRKQDLG